MAFPSSKLKYLPISDRHQQYRTFWLFQPQKDVWRPDLHPLAASLLYSADGISRIIRIWTERNQRSRHPLHELQGCFAARKRHEGRERTNGREVKAGTDLHTGNRREIHGVEVEQKAA